MLEVDRHGGTFMLLFLQEFMDSIWLILISLLFNWYFGVIYYFLKPVADQGGHTSWQGQ